MKGMPVAVSLSLLGLCVGGSLAASPATVPAATSQAAATAATKAPIGLAGMGLIPRPNIPTPANMKPIFDGKSLAGGMG